MSSLMWTLDDGMQLHPSYRPSHRDWTTDNILFCDGSVDGYDRVEDFNPYIGGEGFYYDF